MRSTGTPVAFGDDRSLPVLTKNLQEGKYISLGYWVDLLRLVKSLLRSKLEKYNNWFNLAPIIKVVIRKIIQKIINGNSPQVLKQEIK